MHPVSRIFPNPRAKEREREKERSGRNDWLARTKWRGCVKRAAGSAYRARLTSMHFALSVSLSLSLFFIFISSCFPVFPVQ